LALRTALGRGNDWFEIVGNQYLGQIDTSKALSPDAFQHLLECAKLALPFENFVVCRELRNKIAHVNEFDFVPTATQAKHCLQYCTTTISKLDSLVIGC